VASTPLLLYVNSEFAAKNVGEFVDLLKKSQGKYSYGC